MKRQSACSLLCMIALAIAGLSACKSEAPPPVTPVAGTAVSGIGAPAAGVGGPIAGVMSAPAAGMSAPAAGVSAPAGGMGAAAGMTAAAGTGGDQMGAITCAGAKTGAAAALHAAAVTALLPPMPLDPNKLGPCAFSSCHGTNAKKAGLVLDGMMPDLNALLVGRPACQAPTFKLVDGSGGDAALAKSWIWQKLTAPAMAASGALIVKPEWGMPAMTCNQDSGQMFGRRMPDTRTADLITPMESLFAIRDWICAGAPKP